MCGRMEVLKELRKEAWASVFRFGSVAFEEIYELGLFEKTCVV